MTSDGEKAAHDFKTYKNTTAKINKFDSVNVTKQIRLLYELCKQSHLTLKSN